MNSETTGTLKRIVIVGGGSAGWITAGLLASEHVGPDSPVSVTLVESPDVKTIGVGEGTWPTMRTTLGKIGLSETDFLRECTASFKQGTKFIGWVTGAEGDSYYHPFTAPAGYPAQNPAAAWLAQGNGSTFVDAVTAQGRVCDRDLAPKQLATPEYAGVCNYAYHLDAGKFADLLMRHCTAKLGVHHVLDHVTGINGAPDEDIRSVSTRGHGEIEGDLFIDCSGFAAMLLGKHYGVPFIDRTDILFNDTALAVQLPYDVPDSPIASQTNATAQEAGWIWDIALATRRGIGHVYSSAHMSDTEADKALRDYIGRTSGQAGEAFEPRKISFAPGHRQKFWHRNCVAVGMSAGFLEPLEASALVLVELAGRMLGEELPANRAVMDIVAKRYNDRFLYRWGRIIDFLKLHYVLSRRDGPFWADNRAAGGIPDSLQELLALWRYHVPSGSDFPQTEEVFSAASHQFVLYGMGFRSDARLSARQQAGLAEARRRLSEIEALSKQWLAGLPGNRELLDELTAKRLPPSERRLAIQE